MSENSLLGNSSTNNCPTNNNTNNDSVYASVAVQIDAKKLPNEIILKRDIRKYYEFKEILGT